jgi:hypothetical protein
MTKLNRKKVTFTCQNQVLIKHKQIKNKFKHNFNFYGTTSYTNKDQ